MTADNSEGLLNGGRIVISITATYRPIVPLVPIPPLPMTFISARSIFTMITGPTPAAPPPPDLALGLTSQPNPVAPGAPFTYTLTVGNAGASTLTSIRVTDTLPTGVTFLSAIGTDWTCGRTNNIVTCSRVVLPVSTTSFINIRVTAPTIGGWLTDTATATASQIEINTANNSANTSTLVTSGADLAVGLTDTPDPATHSGLVTYTIGVVNNGTTTANSVSVSQTLPAGASFDTIVGSGWSCIPSGSVATCTRPSLAVGAAPNITARVNTPASGSILTSTASIGSASPVDPILTNNTWTVTTTLASTADLALTLTDTPDPVGLGGSVVYNLKVTNIGPSTTAATLTNTLPAGTTYLNISAPGWTCNQAGGLITCSHPALAVGPASDIYIYVTVPNFSTTLINSASVTGSVTDPNPADNNATANTSVLNCNPGIASAEYSNVLASLAQVQADGQQTSDVLVTVKDDCGNLLANQPLTLASSRATQDTITPASGTTNVNGQFTFVVKSGTTSPYLAGTFTPSVFTATVGTAAISQTTQVAFVCVTGALAPFSGSQDIQYSFTNNTGINRRLVGVQLIWPSAASRKATSLNFGPNQIWSGHSNSSPLDLTGGWTAGDRTLNTTASKTLKFNFNYAVSGTGTYTLVTIWDDTAGNSLCTAPTITITR